MKKLLLSLVVLSGFFFAFKPATDVYTVDLTKSKIVWVGRKVTGQHTGEIKIASGSLTANGKALSGGNFIMDMKSMTCKDLDAANGGKLLGHLKSNDFFSVEKNPTSKFEITKITAAGSGKVNILGKLTIKGITSDVSFPANVVQKKGVIVAVANDVKVNRTKYDIKYGSKSFIADIGDKAIDDDFILNISLVAKK